MNVKCIVAALIAAFALATAPSAIASSGEDGSQMWLRYVPTRDAQLLHSYRSTVSSIVVENAGKNKVHRHTEGLRMEPGSSERLVRTSLAAARDELARGLGALLRRDVPVRAQISDGAVIVGTRGSSKTVRRHIG